ncbi:hypothetical protein [[Phormidium ambiguum] IAM M-71]|nr:hypothetical protein [Phormidium ambiguum]
MNQKKLIQSHRDLEVYQLAFEVAMEIFELIDILTDYQGTVIP